MVSGFRYWQCLHQKKKRTNLCAVITFFVELEPVHFWHCKLRRSMPVIFTLCMYSDLFYERSMISTITSTSGIICSTVSSNVDFVYVLICVFSRKFRSWLLHTLFVCWEGKWFLYCRYCCCFGEEGSFWILVFLALYIRVLLFFLFFLTCLLHSLAHKH